MAVISCNVDDAYCDEDQNGYRDYTVVYRVITDAITGPNEALNYASLPTRNSFYSVAEGVVSETNTGASFRGKGIRYQGKDESRKIFLVTVKFSDNPGTGQDKDPEQPPGLPWDAPADISTHSQKDKRAILLDLDGNMIASSAGEPYDPVQEVDDTHYILRIVKNFLNIDLPFNASYRDAVNSDVFFGCAPETVKVETPGAMERLWFGPQKYFRLTWEFALKSNDDISEPGSPIAILDDWRIKLYDYGMYKLVGVAPNQKLEAITDLHGAKLTAPRLLDNNGAVLGIGETPKLRRTPLGYRGYRSLPFAALGLPTEP